jgi:hypothetical protein
MTRWFSFTLSVCWLLAAATLAAAQTVNMAGDWEVVLKTPKGDVPGKATLKQDGEKLSGVVKGKLGVRSMPIEGTIQGRALKLFLTLRDSNSDIPVTLTGEVEGDVAKGRADFGGITEGSWTAKRLAEATPAMADKAPASEVADVSGEWVFEVETDAGSSSPMATFKQEGGKLTGQFKGAFGEAPLTGTVKGAEISFSFKVQAQGAEVTVTYTGTIEKSLMKGRVQTGDLHSGAWSATRQ